MSVGRWTIMKCPTPSISSDCDPGPQCCGTRPGQYVRLTLCRRPGPDFSERDRAVLTLLGPHLDQAYLDVQRRRHPAPRLTPRQADLLRLLAAGHTNTQIARRLGISDLRGLFDWPTILVGRTA